MNKNSGVLVTAEEITRFDPMIHQVIKNEILKYWGNGVNVYDRGTIIGRLGMSFEDLMQYGRLLVMNQIRWFKAHGLDPKTGKPKNAKMTTLVFQHLRNKLMSLSKSFASDKHGGQVVNVVENRALLQKFLDTLDKRIALRENLVALGVTLVGCSKEVQNRCNRQYKSNADLAAHLRRILSGLDGTAHVSYEEVESFAAESLDMNPEEALLAKEEIARRLQKYRRTDGLLGPSLMEYVNRKKKVTPKFLPKDKTTLLMQLARKKGIASQRELAEKLGIGMTTLSNVVRGRSRGTARLRAELEHMFGRPFSKLLEIIDVR